MVGLKRTLFRHSGSQLRLSSLSRFMAEPLRPSSRLDALALRRSVAHMPTSSPTLQTLAAKLKRNKPVLLATIGQSNSANKGGCYQDGCKYWITDSGYKYSGQRGWITQVMEMINNTYPSDNHSAWNAAQGGDHPFGTAPCVSSLIPSKTDILLVDYGISRWNLESQERLIRAILRLTKPPFLLLIDLIRWCCPWRRKNTRKCDQFNSCFRNFTSPTLNDSLTLAHYYDVGLISSTDAIVPLLGTHKLEDFDEVTAFMDDEGYHGLVQPQPYYNALADMVYHFIHQAVQVSTRARIVRRRIPKPIRVDSPRSLNCFGWAHARLRPPQQRHAYSGSNSSGWFVSSSALHGSARNKPGLYSRALNDSIQLLIEKHLSTEHGEEWLQASSNSVDKRREKELCASMAFLSSYAHVGSVWIECVSPCRCKTMHIQARSPKLESIINTTEFAFRTPTSCWLRVTNVESNPPSDSHEFMLSKISTFLPRANGSCS